MRHPSENPLLEVSPYASDGGQLIGRDPRDIPAEDYVDRLFLFGLQAIRAKCLDCALDPKEVRKLSFPLKTGPLHWPQKGELAWQGSDIRTKTS